MQIGRMLMYGLIGAMSVEVEALMAQLENREEKRIGLDVFVSGKLFGKDAVLSVCGPGKINAALCAQSMILHYQPEWILNLGVAGAGDTSVSIGDMVIATAAVQHDMDTSPIGDPVGLVSKLNLVELPCDEALRAKLVKATSRVEGVNVHEGIIATGDQFINSGDVRSRIHQLFNAKAVEMEGEKNQFVFDDLAQRVERYPNDLHLRFELGKQYFTTTFTPQNLIAIRFNLL